MPRESIYKDYEPAVTPGLEDGASCYLFAFSHNRLLFNDAPSGIPSSDDLAGHSLALLRKQYLGKLRGKPCYSAELEKDAVAPDGMSFRDIRTLYGVVDEDVFLLAGRAIQIMSWDQTNQYCGRCGNEMQTLTGERAKKCPACGFTSYPRLSPAVIVSVLRGDKLLLAHYASFRGNMYTIIAGFVEPGETLEECIAREVSEETGIKVKNPTYFGSQPWPFPNSLMIGFTAEYAGGEISVDGKEISAAGWYDANHLPELPPKMSIAREMIDWFARRSVDVR